MARALTLAVTGLWWAVMMGLLVRNEIIPYLEYQAAPTYRTVLHQRPDREMNLRSIRIGGEVVGQARSVTYSAPGHGWNIYTDFQMSLAGFPSLKLAQQLVPGGMDKIALVTRQRVSAAYELERFTTTGQSPFPVTLQGHREGDKLRLSYQIPMLRGEAEVPSEKMSMLAGGYTPLASVGRPSVGKQWKVQTLDFEFDLFSGKPKFMTVYARIEDREDLRLAGGKKVPAYRVEFRKDPKKELPISRMWVDDEGEVLLEEMTVANLSCRIQLEEKRILSLAELNAIIGGAK